MVIKDLGGAQAGEPHHRGVRALRDIDHRATVDSALYKKLIAAGFIAIGRTNTPDWGCTIATELLAHGPSLNPETGPHETRHWPPNVAT